MPLVAHVPQPLHISYVMTSIDPHAVVKRHSGVLVLHAHRGHAVHLMAVRMWGKVMAVVSSSVLIVRWCARPHVIIPER